MPFHRDIFYKLKFLEFRGGVQLLSGRVHNLRFKGPRLRSLDVSSMIKTLYTLLCTGVNWKMSCMTEKLLTGK